MKPINHASSYFSVIFAFEIEIFSRRCKIRIELMAQLHLERQQAKNKNFLYIGDKEMIMKKFKMIRL